jgi:hypothetical protein
MPSEAYIALHTAPSKRRSGWGGVRILTNFIGNLAYSLYPMNATSAS